MYLLLKCLAKVVKLMKNLINALEHRGNVNRKIAFLLNI